MTQATGTLGPAVAEFFAGCLLIPEGPHEGEPFVLEPWQREAIDIMYETDANDLPMWKIGILGIPRGNGKSPLTGGLADHALVTGHGSPQVYCTAAAKSQAGIVHKHANKEARGGPLEDFLEFPRVGEALGPIKCPSNNGVLRVLSADGDLQQGLVPAFVAEDEPHTFTTGKQVGLHFAMTTALHKRDDSRMVMITTAGKDKNSLLGELIDAIIENGEMEVRNNGCLLIVRDYEAKRVLIWYGAPEDADVSDPAIWRACNPASWISDEALRVAAASNPESEFRRFYLNQWVKGEDAAIQPAAWDACKREGTIPPDSEIWVAADNGGTRDTGALVWVCPRPNGRLRVHADIFMAPEGRATAAPLIEAEMRRLYQTYRVRRINYDRWQMDELAGRLSAEGFPMQEFPQDNSHMVPASQLTFDLINEAKLMHDGDVLFRRQVLGTGGETTNTGGWRFVKAKTKSGNRDLTKNNDAMIALAMAIAGWQEDNPPGGEPWVMNW